MFRAGLDSKIRSTQAIAGAVLIAILMSLFLIACTTSTEKLDEAFIYEGPQFKLKLVRYYENLPFHYVGEVFNVQCSSAHTAGSPGNKRQDPGWVTLGNGGAIGSNSAQELAERERNNYFIFDERTLAWTGTGVNVSFDACGSFRSWHPVSLPAEMIISAEKPDYCRPKGTADCRHYDFIGDRGPRFEQIQVSPLEGRISFVVHSRGLRNAGGLRVRSTDFGKTWQIEAMQ